MKLIDEIQDWRGNYLNLEEDCKWYHSPYAKWIDISYGDRWTAGVYSDEVDNITVNTEDEKCNPDDVTEVY